MTATSWDLDGIVREVIKRLRDAGAGRRTRMPAAATTNRPKPANPRELTITDRVVSLSAIDGRLSGIRRIVTRPEAVVTPSVRDELKARRIELVCEGTASVTSDTTAKAILAVVGRPRDAGGLVESIGRVVGRPERYAAEDLLTALRHVAEEITNHETLGVLLTDQPVAAHCLANRIDGIRAAWAVDREAVRQAVNSIGANLLVMDPDRVEAAQAADLVQQFVDGGARHCAAAYRVILERAR